MKISDFTNEIRAIRDDLTIIFTDQDQRVKHLDSFPKNHPIFCIAAAVSLMAMVAMNANFIIAAPFYAAFYIIKTAIAIVIFAFCAISLAALAHKAYSCAQKNHFMGS